MKKLGQGALGTGTGTLLYTVPTGYKAEVLDINISNTASTALTCAIHLAPTGVAVGTSNALFPTVTVQPNQVIQWTGVQFLNAGDFIQGIGSASGITGATYVAIGNGSFVETDSPDAVTGAVKATSVTTSKLRLITVILVQANVTKETNNPFQARIDFPIVRGDYLVVTGTVATGSCEAVIEWGEAL